MDALHDNDHDARLLIVETRHERIEDPLIDAIAR
jgi:hypothetical protein